MFRKPTERQRCSGPPTITTLALADLLIAAGANVKKANREGATPMYLASIRGSAPMIDRLLKAGADPNEAGPQGETPLMLASRNGNLEAIKVLLDHKADVNGKEELRGTTPIMWASSEGHPDAVKLLIATGRTSMRLAEAGYRRQAPKQPGESRDPAIELRLSA